MSSTTIARPNKRRRETDDDLMCFEDFYDEEVVLAEVARAEEAQIRKKLEDSQKRCAYLEQVVENLSKQIQILCNMCSITATIASR